MSNTYAIQHFFDPDTWTLSYVVFDELSKDALVIDPVLNYDPASSTFWTDSVQQLSQFISEQKLKLHAVVETHAHADHISGAQFLKEMFPSARIGIGKRITIVQETFKAIYNLKDLATDGSQFDFLIDAHQTYAFGTLNLSAIFTPGHTPACASYLLGDAVFTGDALFMPDYGTGRCDFPGGNAKVLFHSIHEELYDLSDAQRTFTGHDYMPQGRDLKYVSTIAEQKQSNIHLKASTREAEFIRFRTERDKGLAAPRLLLPSIQLNIQAGRMPVGDDKNLMFLKIPFGAR